MTLIKILEILEILHKMTAGKQDREWALDHANSLRTRRLHVRVLEREREDELEQRLGNVELQWVLRRNQNQGLVEKDGFPAIYDSPDVKHVK